MFDKRKATQTALSVMEGHPDKKRLVSSFAEICEFLSDVEDAFSWPKNRKIQPNITANQHIETLAGKYFNGFKQSNFPTESSTIADSMVSVVLQVAFEYSKASADKIEITHSHAMTAENCIGALLERYLDSVLWQYGWHWCCGDFVKYVDFVTQDKDGKWLALQIKNRSNSENSASSSVRQGTDIQKWFRSHATKGGTNWDNLPSLMQGKGLSEEGFINFVKTYLNDNHPTKLLI